MVTEERISRMKRTFFIDNVKKYVCVVTTANSEWNKHPYQKLLHFVMFYTIGKLFFWIKHVNFKLPKHGNKGNNWE